MSYKFDRQQSNGNGPHHRGGYDDAYNTLQRKEINTALTTGKAEPIVEPKATMKPISGPPVYYPPGKEMFTKSEESQAAWRAQVNPSNTINCPSLLNH